jgi:hypothetical protein
MQPELYSSPDERRVSRHLGYSLLFKMTKLASALQNLRKLVTDQLDQAKAKGFKREPWQVVKSIAPTPDRITFSAEEMAVVLSLDSNVFNQIATMDDLHNSAIALFELYGSQRNLLLEQFDATLTGKIRTTGLSQEQAQWLAPRAAMLNDLVSAMVQRTEQDGREAWIALNNLHRTLEKEFRLNYKLELQ